MVNQQASGRKIQGLVFDLDGTLFDSELAYGEALASVGIPIQSARYREARALVKTRLGERHVNSHNRLLYFKVMFESEGRFSPTKTLELMERYEAALQERIAGQWKTLRRAELFAALKKTYPIVLLTNENTRTQLLKLRAIDPTGESFPHVITSEDQGEEKPSHKMLAAAVERLGVEPRACMMIGDSLEMDVLPALALGMTAALTSEFHARNQSLECPAGVMRIDRLDRLREAAIP